MGEMQSARPVEAIRPNVWPKVDRCLLRAPRLKHNAKSDSPKIKPREDALNVRATLSGGRSSQPVRRNVRVLTRRSAGNGAAARRMMGIVQMVGSCRSAIEAAAQDLQQRRCRGESGPSRHPRSMALNRTFRPRDQTPGRAPGFSVQTSKPLRRHDNFLGYAVPGLQAESRREQGKQKAPHNAWRGFENFGSEGGI
jgi:hypothetical protein